MTETLRRIMPTRLGRIFFVVALAVPLAGISSFEALFAPSAELWPRWEKHDPASRAAIDHAPWERLLKTYVSADPEGLHRFDYRGVSAADRMALEDYVAALAAVAIDRYNRDEQQAYWINLYNALTVRLILQHYPVESIRDIDISPGLFSDGPWDKALITVAGEALTLNDIEHRILRPIWGDPRIHYAVNCASVGCPNLARKAFTGANTETLLELGARDYVNSPRGTRLESDRLVISSIYVWFQEDFGGNEEGIVAHLLRYAEPALAARLKEAGPPQDHAYDWSLNDTLGPAVN